MSALAPKKGANIPKAKAEGMYRVYFNPQSERTIEINCFRVRGQR